MKTIPPLWPHQKLAVKFALDHPAVYDASDPGTGKTRSYLEVIKQLREKQSGKALVVCPLSLMLSAWGDDAAKYYPGLELSYAFAPAAIRRAAMAKDVDITVINTDGLRWLADKGNLPLLKGYEILVIDEITKFKHRTSARSKAAALVAKRFARRIGMSGTPIANGVQDMWHQAYLLDDGRTLGTGFSAYRSAFCIPRYNGFGWEWSDRPEAEQLLYNLMSKMMIRFPLSLLNLPPNHVRTINFHMPKKLSKEYAQFAKEAYLRYKAGEITAVNAAVERGKLHQIASGAVYDAAGQIATLSNERNELILDLIEERKCSVVFYNWIHQRDALLAEAAKRKIPHEHVDGSTPYRRRAEITRAYQAGDFRVLFMHHETGSHGLTLTRGTATIWASPQYKPDNDKQGLHRILRGGQTQETETIHVIAPGTVDEVIHANRDAKLTKMQTLLGLATHLEKFK